MNTPMFPDEPGATPRSGRGFPLKLMLVTVFLCGPLVLLLGCAAGVVSYFVVTPEVRALRNSVLEASPETQWEKQIELHAGRFTVGALQLGAKFIPDIPEEGRIAIRAARSGEASVYKFHGAKPDGVKILNDADEAMSRRGWSRIVGVVHEDATVAVYLPPGVDEVNTRACVLVVSEDTLVCASGRADLRELAELGLKHLPRELNL